MMECCSSPPLSLEVYLVLKQPGGPANAIFRGKLVSFVGARFPNDFSERRIGRHCSRSIYETGVNLRLAKRRKLMLAWLAGGR